MNKGHEQFTWKKILWTYEKMVYFTYNNGNTIILTINLIINLNYPESKGKGPSISKEIF